MTTETFTLVHVLISLVGIGSGLIVVFGLVGGKRLDRWTTVFLATTVATSVTGFGFPFEHLLPSHKVGIISLIVLAVTILARYAFHLSGGWRRIYVIGAVIALYLNVFVAVVQAFQKVPALKAMAPTQSEPPFLIAQIAVLVLFVVLAIVSAKRFSGLTGTASP
ncbi:MAG TPA: hypothetical protein VK579_00170 [Terriglobales bacterium]|nr:hypothetical protein [Terriglobales bacterium]